MTNHNCAIMLTSIEAAVSKCIRHSDPLRDADLICESTGRGAPSFMLPRMLREGWDPNARDADGRTALAYTHLAPDVFLLSSWGAISMLDWNGNEPHTLAAGPARDAIEYRFEGRTDDSMCGAMARGEKVEGAAIAAMLYYAAEWNPPDAGDAYVDPEIASERVMSAARRRDAEIVIKWLVERGGSRDMDPRCFVYCVLCGLDDATCFMVAQQCRTFDVRKFLIDERRTALMRMLDQSRTRWDLRKRSKSR
jgi:hypothetical protein